MSLQKWLEYGWLRPHKSSQKEISDLLRIIDRDLREEVIQWLKKQHQEVLSGDK